MSGKPDSGCNALWQKFKNQMSKNSDEPEEFPEGVMSESPKLACIKKNVYLHVILWGENVWASLSYHLLD